MGIKITDPETGQVFDNIRDAKIEYCNKHSPCPTGPCPLIEHNRAGECTLWAKAHPVKAARLLGYKYEITQDEKEENLVETKGLHVKYDVKKVETGETINNCFVLRPDKDLAAVAALRTYARVTPNKTLADDIIAWVGAKKNELWLAEMLGVEENQEWRYQELEGKYRIHSGVREYWDINNGWLSCDSEEDLAEIIRHPEKIIRIPRLTEPEAALMRAMGASWVSRDDTDGSRVCLWRWRPEADPGNPSTFWGGEDGYNLIAEVAIELFPSVKRGDCF